MKKETLIILVSLLIPLPAGAVQITPSASVGQNSQTGAAGTSSFNSPAKIAIDTKDHWLAVSDSGNHRVLIFPLNSSTNLPTSSAATYVLGQADFNSTQANRGGSAAANTLNCPQGLLYDSVMNRLFVADRCNNRVLVFDASNLSSGMSASNVLGQTNFTNTATAAGRCIDNDRMAGPTNLAMSGPSGTLRLIVSDTDNNRLLDFTDVTKISDGMKASYVIGQTDFSSSVCASSSDDNRLHTAYGVAFSSDGNTLYVADGGNNRVLIFDVTKRGNNLSASTVLGQTAFGQSSTGTGATTLNSPSAVLLVGNNLFVTDGGNHRIMVWNSPATTTAKGAAASSVIGQNDFITATAVNAPTQTGFNGPGGITSDGGDKFYVLDVINNRVLIYDMLTVSAPNLSVSKGTAKTSGTVPAPSASANPLGATLACSSWTQTSGSTCTLSSTTSCTPTITCSTSGSRAFSFTSTAGGFTESGDTLSVTITDTAPTAALTGAATTSGQTIRSGTSVSLTCACTDADSDTSTCTVSQTSGTTVTLSSASSCSPTFTAGKRGDYAFSCTCNDGDNGTGSGTVTVTSANSPSTVTVDTSKTANTTCSCCDTCTLNSGITASDPDGDTLTYSWAVTTQATGTACSCPSALVDEGILEPTPQALTINNSDAATATFTPQNEGDYSFTLTVTDSGGGTTTQSVKKTIQAVDTTTTTASTSKDCSPTGSGGAGGCGLTDSDCRL